MNKKRVVNSWCIVHDHNKIIDKGVDPLEKYLDGDILQLNHRFENITMVIGKNAEYYCLRIVCGDDLNNALYLFQTNRIDECIGKVFTMVESDNIIDWIKTSKSA